MCAKAFCRMAPAAPPSSGRIVPHSQRRAVVPARACKPPGNHRRRSTEAIAWQRRGLRFPGFVFRRAISLPRDGAHNRARIRSRSSLKAPRRAACLDGVKSAKLSRNSKTRRSDWIFGGFWGEQLQALEEQLLMVLLPVHHLLRFLRGEVRRYFLSRACLPQPVGLTRRKKTPIHALARRNCGQSWIKIGTADLLTRYSPAGPAAASSASPLGYRMPSGIPRSWKEARSSGNDPANADQYSAAASDPRHAG